MLERSATHCYGSVNSLDSLQACIPKQVSEHAPYFLWDTGLPTGKLILNVMYLLSSCVSRPVPPGLIKMKAVSILLSARECHLLHFASLAFISLSQ